MTCRLSAGGRVGLHGSRPDLRPTGCAGRIEGCYDLEDIRVLSLFGGNGYIAAQAVQAGATVHTYVEADAELLELARDQAGSHQVQYVHEDVMDHVEEAAAPSGALRSHRTAGPGPRVMARAASSGIAKWTCPN